MENWVSFRSIFAEFRSNFALFCFCHFLRLFQVFSTFFRFAAVSFSGIPPYTQAHRPTTDPINRCCGGCHHGIISPRPPSRFISVVTFEPIQLQKSYVCPFDSRPPRVPRLAPSSQPSASLRYRTLHTAPAKPARALGLLDAQGWA